MNILNSFPSIHPLCAIEYFTLAVNLYGSACIVFNDTIYAFGGSGNVWSNRWQYYYLGTFMATMAPSVEPTTGPSFDPTQEPSYNLSTRAFSTSLLPSMDPTTLPSLSLTQEASYTNQPSLDDNDISFDRGNQVITGIIIGGSSLGFIVILIILMYIWRRNNKVH